MEYFREYLIETFQHPASPLNIHLPISKSEIKIYYNYTMQKDDSSIPLHEMDVKRLSKEDYFSYCRNKKIEELL